MREKTVPSVQIKVRAPGSLDAVQQANKAGVVCRHCKVGKINRPRRLCWSCYYKPGVRALYPSTSKYARRGVGEGMRCNPPPDPSGPTRTAPGTPEKMEVLAFRAKYGYALWHEADARMEGDPRVDEWFRIQDSVAKGEAA